MGMMEDCEASLQVLRGFDTDISLELNEIKVTNQTFPLYIAYILQVLVWLVYSIGFSWL